MGFDPTPKQILMAPFAIYFALAIGIPLSNARNAAAMPMLAECGPALLTINADGLTPMVVADLAVCGSGIFIIYFVPGAIGVFLLTMDLR